MPPGTVSYPGSGHGLGADGTIAGMTQGLQVRVTLFHIRMMMAVGFVAWYPILVGRGAGIQCGIWL